MAGNEYVQPHRDDEQPDEPEPVAPAVQNRDTEVDALREEIDDVLEQNAEQLVRGFVQKGGQ